jgi:predicted XRE-type DNA-binding protein
MGMPPKKVLDEMRKKLEKAEPSRLLPPNASKADCLKYELCKLFVVHLNREKISQKALAEKLGIEPARLNEIVKYRIDLFTVDRLLGYAELLELDLDINVTVA